MIEFPDYQNCLVNLSSSILQEFGVNCAHSGLQILDQTFSARRYQNVVLFVIDGMGVKALQDHLPPAAFLNQQMAQTISSVFPPTTTAATTSLLSGKTPAEHGWLGWDLFFPELQQIVVPFLNTVKDSTVPASVSNAAGTFLPYTDILTQIQRTSTAEAYLLSQFANPPIRTLDEILEKIAILTGHGGRKFIYAYWNEPDATMHTEGCRTPAVRDILLDLNQRIEKLSMKLNDTLLILTADHGHINITNRVIADYPELAKMLAMPTSIEPRAVSFHLKREFREQFPAVFNQYFGEDFLLFSHDEVFEKQLFGTGKVNLHTRGSLGDFLAAAVKDTALVYSDRSRQFKSHHAGLTTDEMRVPLILAALE